MKTAPGVCGAIVRVAVVLVSLLFGLAGALRADDAKPLRPVDTSGPRATLQGFMATGDTIYQGWARTLNDYATSDRLYLGAGERAMQAEMLALVPRAMKALDLSEVLPLLEGTVGIERAVQLKGILDRIDMPAWADIPDGETMQRLGLKRWRLPDTEIDIVRIEQGPRTGEYLVSAETVARLPEFYERVSGLPDKPGASRDLAEALRRVSGGKPITIYQALLNSPIGLGAIVPPRWILGLPDWARARILDVSVWQWSGLAIELGVAVLVLMAAVRLRRRLSGREEDEGKPIWRALPVPIAIFLLAGVITPVFGALLRIGGEVRVAIFYLQMILLYLAAAWLAIIGAVVVGDLIVSSEQLKRHSLDSQLIKLGLRLVGVAAAVGFLIQGADRVGFPAYSVIAGLGVGGLAVALAARDSIANLLGSVLILIEKPFRVGHYIKVGGNEGTVEDVGFRSTRIRTPDNSLISIPNNAVVNTTIENMTLRGMRRQRFFVQVTYDTPRATLEALAAGIRQLIVEHPLTNKGNIQVRFNNLNESSLDILVMFFIETDSYATELAEREALLLQLMDLAKDLDVEFAFPTRTIHIETDGAADRPIGAKVARWPVPLG